MPESECCARRCSSGPHFCGSSSRKSFTPPDHWLISSQIDLSSFIEAAV